MHKVRVMHLVHGLRPGGMEFGVLKIVNALAESPVASSICSTVPSEGMKHLVHPSVPVHEFNRAEGNDPRVVWQIYQLLRRERPDILHTHAWGTLYEGLIAGRLAGVPAIVHGEHGTLQLSPRQIKAQRWGWMRADQVLSVSSRLAQRMARETGFPLKRVRVIRNGVDLARFDAAHSAPARTAPRLASDRSVRIGAVGRLVDVKDHWNLIEAVRLLRERGCPATAVIAGEGPLRSALEAQITHAGLQAHVTLLGHRPDIETVLGALDVFVQPSRSEGMSNTILEAMASRLPVVATHVGGADEMVLDGTTGILVPVHEPPALASALERLVTSEPLRQAMGTAGRIRVEREFSLQAMIDGYRSVYCALLPHRTATPGAGRAAR